MPNTAPVENEHSCEASHATIAANSSTSTKRFIEMFGPDISEGKGSENTGSLDQGIEPAAESGGHGREHPKSTDDCSARFRARLGAGFRCSPRCAHVSCGPVFGHRIVGAVLFGVGIPPGLAAASVAYRFDSGPGLAHLAGNKCRWSDRQTGIHHRRAGVPAVRAGHDHVLRGEFAAAVTGLRIAAVVVAAGSKTT
jgi:hypothetical protein